MVQRDKCANCCGIETLNKGSPYGVVANMLDCNINSYSYAPFQTITLGKGMNAFMFPGYRLNSSNIVFLLGWLWHWITQEGWYAIK